MTARYDSCYRHNVPYSLCQQGQSFKLPNTLRAFLFAHRKAYGLTSCKQVGQIPELAEDTEVWTIERDDGVVGYLWLGADHAVSAAVLVSHQRKGAFKSALALLIQKLRNRGRPAELKATSIGETAPAVGVRKALLASGFTWTNREKIPGLPLPLDVATPVTFIINL